MSNLKSCPSCKASLDGGSISETFIKQRDEGAKYWQGKTNEEIEQYVKDSYSAPYRWGREIGIEFQGEYDGISAWQCPDCKYTWNRFTGKPITYPFTREQNKA